jgi:NADPH2:quinone reductase
VPVTALALKPANLSMEAAGSAGLVFVTAWSAMATAGRVAPGETVLVIGAGGGVGSAATQIAKAHGARIIGAVVSDNDVKTAEENGADEVIVPSSTGFVETVRKLTGAKGVNLSLDTSGRMFDECVESAAMEGRVSIITAPPDGKINFNLRTIYRNEMTVRGVDTRRLDAIACAKLLNQMLSNFESGKFRMKPGEARPLSAASQAYQEADHGGRFYIFNG